IGCSPKGAEATFAHWGLVIHWSLVIGYFCCPPSTAPSAGWLVEVEVLAGAAEALRSAIPARLSRQTVWKARVGSLVSSSSEAFLGGAEPSSNQSVTRTASGRPSRLGWG